MLEQRIESIRMPGHHYHWRSYYAFQFQSRFWMRHIIISEKREESEDFMMAELVNLTDYNLRYNAGFTRVNLNDFV